MYWIAKQDGKRAPTRGDDSQFCFRCTTDLRSPESWLDATYQQRRPGVEVACSCGVVYISAISPKVCWKLVEHVTTRGETWPIDNVFSEDGRCVDGQCRKMLPPPSALGTRWHCLCGDTWKRVYEAVPAPAPKVLVLRYEDESGHIADYHRCFWCSHQFPPPTEVGEKIECGRCGHLYTAKEAPPPPKAEECVLQALFGEPTPPERKPYAEPKATPGISFPKLREIVVGLNRSVIEDWHAVEIRLRRMERALDAIGQGDPNAEARFAEDAEKASGILRGMAEGVAFGLTLWKRRG